MNEIRLRNFRCFRDEQKARLGPLTLLVGENSTGKTSFLALIRALWDLGYRHELPDFKEDPYDLGSFDEIAHHRGARGGRATMFEAGFTGTPPATRERPSDARADRSFDFTFSRDRNQPTLTRKRVRHGDASIEVDLGGAEGTVGTPNGTWRCGLPSSLLGRPFDETHTLFPWGLFQLIHFSENPFAEMRDGGSAPSPLWTSLRGPDAPSAEDREVLRVLAGADSASRVHDRPYASAPVRSKPRRTYDPSRLTHDPEGEAVPMYLADASYRSQRT